MRNFLYGFIGIIIYWIDPVFRRLVDEKASGGINEEVKSGEEVIIILRRQS